MGFWDIAMQMLEARRKAKQPQPAPAPPMPTVVAERRDPKTGMIMTETSNVVQGADGPHMIVTREPRRPTVTFGTAYGEPAPRPMPGDAIAQAAGFLKKK